MAKLMAKIPKPGEKTGERVAAVPAPPSRRFLAFLVDFFIINFFIAAPFRKLLDSLIPEDMGLMKVDEFLTSNTEAASFILVIALASGILSLLYFAVLEYKLGCTIGKILFGLRVINGNGETPLFWQCLVRSLFIIPVFPFVIFWVIDPVYVFITPTKQRLLEVWSRTRTISFVVV